jgi:hypothetical protein
VSQPWTDDTSSEYDRGFVDGAEYGRENAPYFNDYLGAMKRDLAHVFKIDVDHITDENTRRQLALQWAYAAMEEITEMMGELQWKPWKASVGASLLKPGSSTTKLAGEAADALHFIAHLLNLVGVTEDELNEALACARAKNERRQTEGYSYAAGGSRA